MYPVAPAEYVARTDGMLTASKVMAIRKAESSRGVRRARLVVFADIRTLIFYSLRKCEKIVFLVLLFILNVKLVTIIYLSFSDVVRDKI